MNKIETYNLNNDDIVKALCDYVVKNTGISRELISSVDTFSDFIVSTDMTAKVTLVKEKIDIK